MTQSVNLIAAVGRQGQVGLAGRLPWHNPADLAFFRRMTMGGAIVVGRGTRPAMPYLPGRMVYTFGRGNTPKGLLDLIALQYPGWPVWIAGGPHTWRTFADHINGLRLISLIDYDGPADTWFPFDAFGMDGPSSPQRGEDTQAARGAADRLAKVGEGVFSEIGSYDEEQPQ